MYQPRVETHTNGVSLWIMWDNILRATFQNGKFHEVNLMLSVLLLQNSVDCISLCVIRSFDLCFRLDSLSAQSNQYGKVGCSNSSLVGQGSYFKIIQKAPDCYIYFQIFFILFSMGFTCFLAWMLKWLLGWGLLQWSKIRNILAANRS